MKNPIYVFGFLVLAAVLFGCKKEEAEPKVDENGLTREINDLVPQYILDEMQELGMPINGGATPPDLEDTYLASPFVLKNSNIPADIPGTLFADLEFHFYGQNNQDLTIMIDYITSNGFYTEQGEGLGSFIVGDECSFSVFVEVDLTINGDPAKALNVYSGEVVNKGIENFHYANFFLEDYGDPNGVFIEVGEGRVLCDQDRFSPLKGGESEWYTRLPDCPCEYSESLDGKAEMCGTWIDCGAASQEYHYGATYEIRWVPDQPNDPGQQCTYDSAKKLITSGIGAGSPDRDSPDICGWGDILTGQGFPDYDHYCEDVVPWGKGGSLVCSESSVPCWIYLRDWPANKGKNCPAPANPVSDIQHMLRLVGDMSCEEVTLIIKSAKESPNLLIDADLRDYLTGEIEYLPENQLIDKLKNWKDLKSCSIFPSDDLCVLIDLAIANLQ